MKASILLQNGGGKDATDLSYMRTVGEIEQHLNHTDRYAALDRMLSEMGMDVDALRTERSKGPAVFMAEQPGMFPPEYYNRADVVRHIRDRFGMDAERSHPFILSTDGYSGNGDKERNAKKVFSYLDPLPGHLTDAALLSAGQRKKLNAVGYREISFPAIQASVRDTIDGLMTILEASGSETIQEFKNRVQSRDVYKTTEKFLDKTKFNNDRELMDYLSDIRARLEQFDVGRAIEGLRIYHRRAVASAGDETWASYWIAANDEFYRTNHGITGSDPVITSIDPMLSRFVLQIQDHRRLGRWLSSEMQRTGTPGESFERIPLVGFIDADSKYKTAFYDPSTDHVYRGKHSKEQIAWEQLQELAQQEKAVPAYVLKYLLRAAADMYFVIDDVDAKYKTDQDGHIHGIYQSYTHLPYPALRCPPGGPADAPGIGYSYMGGFGTTDATRTDFSRILAQIEEDPTYQSEVA